ncbi:hypothetical protein [Pseudohongiella sp. O18]|uniref:hypothetical protein n=1 Tax=Pseudohongiella sp. O18 TaxID=2904248 RepID=UPI001F2F3878|nr:hypothetical protein [Pseudohongiella sp. O18]
MKTSILVSAILACTLLTPIVIAQQETKPANQSMNMDMDKRMDQMQGNMEKMQQQMEKLHTTTDAGEWHQSDRR